MILRIIAAEYHLSEMSGLSGNAGIEGKSCRPKSDAFSIPLNQFLSAICLLKSRIIHNWIWGCIYRGISYHFVIFYIGTSLLTAASGKGLSFYFLLSWIYDVFYCLGWSVWQSGYYRHWPYPMSPGYTPIKLKITNISRQSMLCPGGGGLGGEVIFRPGGAVFLLFIAGLT